MNNQRVGGAYWCLTYSNSMFDLPGRKSSSTSSHERMIKFNVGSRSGEMSERWRRVKGGSGNSVLSKACTARGNRGDRMDFRDWPFPTDTGRRLAAYVRPGERRRGTRRCSDSITKGKPADPADGAVGLVDGSPWNIRPRYLRSKRASNALCTFVFRTAIIFFC